MIFPCRCHPREQYTAHCDENVWVAAPTWSPIDATNLFELLLRNENKKKEKREVQTHLQSDPCLNSTRAANKTQLVNYNSFKSGRSITNPCNPIDPWLDLTVVLHATHSSLLSFSASDWLPSPNELSTFFATFFTPIAMRRAHEKNSKWNRKKQRDWSIIQGHAD